jgi:hypothetical protein
VQRNAAALFAAGLFAAADFYLDVFEHLTLCESNSLLVIGFTYVLSGNPAR